MSQQYSYILPVNGSGSGFTPVTAKTLCRGLLIQEDGAAPAQGLQYQYNDGSPTPYGTTYTNAAGTPIQIGNTSSTSAPNFGPFVGEPPRPSTGRLGTTMANIRSLTATATSVRVTEIA